MRGLGGLFMTLLGGIVLGVGVGLGLGFLRRSGRFGM